MTLCSGCYEIQEHEKQLEDKTGEENQNEMYEQDVDYELECRYDEQHVDDDSTYPTTQESVVIKHNSDTSELCRKCRRKLVNEVTSCNCTIGYHWKCGGITKDE